MESTPIDATIPIDARLLAMIVHDIRNPLNVIGLTLRVMEQPALQIKADLKEDLGYLRENSGQITRILALLSDLCRLSEQPLSVAPFPFDPARLVADVAEERASKGPIKAFPARVEIDPTSPDSVVLDQARVRMALQYAIGNASGAADRPLSVRSSGAGGRWRVEVAVDRPPPASVGPTTFAPDRFERLCGSDSERTSLEVALAAWLVEGLGGSVRLEVEPGERSTIVIDLPVRAR